MSESFSDDVDLILGDLNAASDEDLAEVLATLVAERQDIIEQIEDDQRLGDVKGREWQHRALTAAFHMRRRTLAVRRTIEKRKAFGAGTKSADEKARRTLAMKKAEAEALRQKARLEEAKAKIQHDRNVVMAGREVLFVEAARQMLSKDQMKAIWERAAADNPDAGCWQDDRPLSKTELAAKADEMGLP